MTSASDQTARIRVLNDQLRQTGIGGRILMTRGVATLDATAQAAVSTTLRKFYAFTPDNDPYGEHDCASFEAPGHRFIFKIDCYALALALFSSDFADAAVAERVLTVMLAEEY